MTKQTPCCSLGHERGGGDKAVADPALARNTSVIEGAEAGVDLGDEEHLSGTRMTVVVIQNSFDRSKDEGAGQEEGSIVLHKANRIIV